MKYQRMRFSKVLKELDTEGKARIWIWLVTFDSKKFICPKYQGKNYYQHHKNLEGREYKKCHFEVRLRANTIFQKSKIPRCLFG
jgi:hypothetical protein